MRSVIGRGAVLGSVLALGLLMTACGGSSHPASSSSPAATSQTVAKILPAMDSAVASAQSVHMSGTGLSGSQKITIDVSFYGKHDMSGLFGESGATVSILAVGGKSYIKMDAGFLKLSKIPSSVCATLCGKYVEVSASDAAQMTGSLSLSAMSKQAFGTLPSSVTKDTADLFRPATYNGQAVLQFRADGYTIDVTQSSPHYPVLVTVPKVGTFVFSEWNSVPPLTAPPAKDVLSLSQLGSAAG